MEIYTETCLEGKEENHQGLCVCIYAIKQHHFIPAVTPTMLCFTSLLSILLASSLLIWLCGKPRVRYFNAGLIYCCWKVQVWIHPELFQMLNIHLNMFSFFKLIHTTWASCTVHYHRIAWLWKRHSQIRPSQENLITLIYCPLVRASFLRDKSIAWRHPKSSCGKPSGQSINKIFRFSQLLSFQFVKFDESHKVTDMKEPQANATCQLT